MPDYRAAADQKRQALINGDDMSRTPQYNLDTQPLWVQSIIKDLKNEVGLYQLEAEKLLDVIEQLESTNEELAKRGEENAQAAFRDGGEAMERIIQSKSVFTNGTYPTTVDL